MKILFYFLISTSLLSAGEVIPYSQYTPQSTISSYLIASGKELNAFLQKISVHVREAPVKNPNKKAVLLIHGLSASPKDWYLLFNDLQQEGYEVYTIYLKYEKEDNFHYSVKKIQEKALAILASHASIDIIGHSLGGVAAVQAVNELTEQQKRVKHLITINSPLNGTTVMNRFTRMFIPQHLIDVLTYNCEFVQKLRKQSIETKKAGVRFFHTATETDHLVRDLDTCFLPQFEEGVVVTDEGHLSTINCATVRKKILDWLNTP